MSRNVPVSIWRPTDGNSEMSQSDSASINTQSSNILITESGNTLIIEAGDYTTIPSTTWSEDDSQ